MRRVTRRRFLQQSAGAALGLAALTGTAVASNERITVGVMGVRGRGNALLHLFAAQKDVNVAYICDIDKGVLEAKGKDIQERTGRTPRLVKDYRTILDDKSGTPSSSARPTTGTPCPPSMPAWPTRTSTSRSRTATTSTKAR